MRWIGIRRRTRPPFSALAPECATAAFGRIWLIDAARGSGWSSADGADWEPLPVEASFILRGGAAFTVFDG